MDIPTPPDNIDEELHRCKLSGDYYPVMFEWYKYVGHLANYFASIDQDSPAIKALSKVHFSVLIGMLNRCSRLMLSNVTLSHEGKFGETTSIIDRSIFESAIKLSWLCLEGIENNFDRFIASGLKTELEFKNKIESNIEERDGQKTQIENRMLESIQNYINKSELTEEAIANSKKLPNLAQMIDAIGKGRLAYIVGQKIGSHHVHGTWVSLWFHYVNEEDGKIYPRDHDCPTHINQYVYIPLVVLDSISAYIAYICTDSHVVDAITGVLDSVSDEIKEIYKEVMGADNEIV